MEAFETWFKEYTEINIVPDGTYNAAYNAFLEGRRDKNKEAIATAQAFAREDLVKLKEIREILSRINEEFNKIAFTAPAGFREVQDVINAWIEELENIIEE